MTRTGKIARLPREIRTEINLRLDRNLPGRSIVEWLNGLPEVQSVLASLFHGKPVSGQNLSEWRQEGGYVEWQTRREFHEDLRESAHGAAELETIDPLMADHAARLLSARILLTLSKWNGDPEDPAFARLKHLSALVRNVTALRRSDHSSARLKMDQFAFHLAAKDRASHRPSASPRPAAVSPLFPSQDLSCAGPPVESVPPPPGSAIASEPRETPVPVPDSDPSEPIKPHQTIFSTAPEAKAGPLAAPTPEEPPPHDFSPSAPASNPLQEPIPSGIVTKSNVTKAAAPPPAASSVPATPVAPPAPLSDAELRQMRCRGLPSDPVPEWRVQLALSAMSPPPWAPPLSGAARNSIVSLLQKAAAC